MLVILEVWGRQTCSYYRIKFVEQQVKKFYRAHNMMVFAIMAHQES